MFDSYGDVATHLYETILRACGPTHFSGVTQWWQGWPSIRYLFMIPKDGKSAI